jgi:hypothetical protein
LKWAEGLEILETTEQPPSSSEGRHSEEDLAAVDNVNDLNLRLSEAARKGVDTMVEELLYTYGVNVDSRRFKWGDTTLISSQKRIESYSAQTRG